MNLILKNRGNYVEKKSFCFAVFGVSLLMGTSWGTESEKPAETVVQGRLEKVEQPKEEKTLSEENMQLAMAFIKDPKTIAQVPEEVREYLRTNRYVCFDPLQNILDMIKKEGMTFDNRDMKSEVIGLCDEVDAGDMRKEMKLEERHLILLRSFANGTAPAAEQKEDLVFVRAAFDRIFKEFIERNFELQKQYNELRRQEAYNEKMGYCGKSIAAALFRSDMRKIGEFFQPMNSAILFHQLTLNKMDEILATMQ